jgi:hypothetical protein
MSLISPDIKPGDQIKEIVMEDRVITTIFNRYERGTLEYIFYVNKPFTCEAFTCEEFITKITGDTVAYVLPTPHEIYLRTLEGRWMIWSIPYEEVGEIREAETCHNS